MKHRTGSSRVLLRLELLSLVLVALCATSASAQPGQVETLVSEGIELRLQNRNAEALQRFRQAGELAPDSPRVLGHLALALHATEAWLESERVMQIVLASESDDWVARHKEELARSLEAVRAHLAWLEVDTRANGELLIDGRHASRLPMRAPLRLVAGKYRLSLRTAEGNSNDTTVEIPARRHLHVAFADVGRPAKEASTPLAPQRSPGVSDRPRASAMRTLGAALLGAGVAGVVASISVGLHALVLRHERDQQCDPNGCTREGLELDARGRQAAQYAAAFGAAGVARIGAGAVLLWLHPLGSAQSPGQASTGSAAVGGSLMLRW